MSVSFNRSKVNAGLVLPFKESWGNNNVLLYNCAGESFHLKKNAFLLKGPITTFERKSIRSKVMKYFHLLVAKVNK